MTKRVFDIAASGLTLMVLSPVLLIIAVLVKVESPGPVLFRQERVGRAGEPFRIHKFRTMPVDAGGPTVSAANDPRVTRLGRALRSSKLDELPQFVDVLRGDMSIVGPRPELPVYVALWPKELRDLILSVRPGITDPASIELRHESVLLQRSGDPDRYYTEVLLPRKIAMYADYVRSRSWRKDLQIIVRTVREVARSS